MVSTEPTQFDVVVVGGGPSGSTVASFVAMQGHKVLLLEKETFPRYQIGESLLPSTVHGICRLLGVSDELERAKFTRKRGGTFRWGANPDPWTFSFAVSEKMAGPTSFAYQVERMKFDDILLRNARRLGVDVRENCAVHEVTVAGDRVDGVRYTGPDGETRTVRATFVVDASGNKSRIYQSVARQRQYSEFFRNIALFGYFENGKRLPEPNSGNILSAAFDSGWFWYIPLTERLTSVGAVIRHDMASKVHGDREQALRSLIAESPMISEYLAGASLVTDGPYGQIRVRKDYSYCNTDFWRPGMVLTGDAACFVDPVFSSGVHLATYSGLLAARSINSVLAGTIDEKTAFAEFEARYRREYRVFYEFLVAFYDMHVEEGSYFWEAKKVTNCPSSELEAFVELVGGVASGESSLTGTDAKAASERITSGAKALADAVNDSDAGSAGPNRGLFGSPVVRAAMAEGAEVQSIAWLGEDGGERVALRDGGLVASADGMSWERPAPLRAS
jgi:halogenation protein CepH